MIYTFSSHQVPHYFNFDYVVEMCFYTRFMFVSQMLLGNNIAACVVRKKNNLFNVDVKQTLITN